MWDEGGLLAFEDDAGGFEGFEVMPDTFGNVNAVDAIFMGENNTVDNSAVVIVCRRPYLASKDHK